MQALTLFIKELLIKHFASEGFKNRVKHKYLPLLKKGVAYLWNKYADSKERKIVSEIYKVTDVVELSKQEPTAFAPTGAIMPLYEQIADKLKVWFVDSAYQGSTGQCVAFTLDNTIRAIAKVIGLGNIAVSPLDVYIDRNTRKTRGDYTGMSPELMFKSVAQKGVAVADLLPRMDDQSQMFKVDDRSFYPDDLIDPFRLKLVLGAEYVDTAWKNVVGVINSLPMGFPLQISILVGDGYFGYDIPLVKNSSIYGGHSVCVIGGSACIVDGQEGFFITDSAYYKGRIARFGTTIRFITKDFWNAHGYTLMLPKFVDSVQKKALENRPHVHIQNVTLTAKIGDSGENVRVIQNALIALGYGIPSGATSFYGNETANAVLRFQLDNVERFTKIVATNTKEVLTSLGGRHFGASSVQVINSIIDEKSQ